MSSSKFEQSQGIIQHHVLWSMGAGAIPIPVLDSAAVIMVQLDMLKQLSRVYEVVYDESSGKHLISVIAGSTLTRLGASYIKTIPGIGTLLGGVSMVILSGASTYAIGKLFTNHFESGGNFFDFDLSWAQKKYEEEFEKGKEYASDLQKNDQEKEPNKGEIFIKLDKLVQLKKSGVISDEEFQSKKEDLLKRL